MILNISFRDGSNPWVTSGDADKICTAWNCWKNNPDAMPFIIIGNMRIYRSTYNRVHTIAWKVFHIANCVDTREFKYLRNAIKYAEREEVKRKCSC